MNDYEQSSASNDARELNDGQPAANDSDNEPWGEHEGLMVLDTVCVVSSESGPHSPEYEEPTKLEIRRSLEECIAFVDSADRTTSHHSARVADVAAALALALGWTPSDVLRLHEAAFFHDVAIGSNSRLGLRRTPPTRDEIELHPTLGDILARLILDADQALWIREHHERMDGCGYPDGWRLARISDGGRILALAEAWDEMTAACGVHEPLSPEEAVAECVRESGTRFAPEVVDALVQLGPTGLTGFSEYAF